MQDSTGKYQYCGMWLWEGPQIGQGGFSIDIYVGTKGTNGTTIDTNGTTIGTNGRKNTIGTNGNFRQVPKVPMYHWYQW